ncbi:cytochrome d ubiquinol oxidase subunit II [Pseudothauera nasutitermitis]|uniref:Cytochrome d ubiquinol oxidase subunit II n=1 Tax=Pseudothauera nasutitermitis TaxID=2565930 RepID=A0A4S4B1G2_9RHOO|nr:cytochrome d ubiquinol oxidase subunit II [Pseudothauera nasutitermitis]THF66402.1 cytochrome d ubiquinol oxidase subunit II [Pseudothauera nasutitermitis]
MDEAYWLPVIFAALMALAILLYVVLDGYDLGVGLLLPFAGEEEKDWMIASIGPFWDANETWLVLGIGLLLVAFPTANGVILGALYLPVAIMLIGLILRGVAFDFRVKAHADHKRWWNAAFAAGSLVTALAQGVMLGRFLTGFAPGALAWIFALLAGVGLAAAYALLGATWLIMKGEGRLQARACAWARRALVGAALGVAAVSLITPLVSQRIAAKWFTLPEFLLVLPLPVVTAALLLALWVGLPRLASRQAAGNDAWCWAPFVGTVGIFLLAFQGLAYSIFPEMVIGRMDIWQAAGHPQGLWVILIGALLVVPAILAYTVFVYRVFWGKTRALTYE